MEKRLKNCEGRRQVRVREVAEVNSRPVKRRKVDDEEMNVSSSFLHLNSAREFVAAPDNSNSQVNAGNLAVEIGGLKDHYAGSSSDEIPASCCSSNRSTEEESVEIGYSFSNSQSTRETTPSREVRSQSGELESTERPLEANSGHRQKPEDNSTAGAKLEAELQQFFLAEEKQLLKQFSNKYNFDFENEKPLEGRFEWVKLKP